MANEVLTDQDYSTAAAGGVTGYLAVTEAADGFRSVGELDIYAEARSQDDEWLLSA